MKSTNNKENTMKEPKKQQEELMCVYDFEGKTVLAKSYNLAIPS